MPRKWGHPSNSLTDLNMIFTVICPLCYAQMTISLTCLDFGNFRFIGTLYGSLYRSTNLEIYARICEVIADLARHKRRNFLSYLPVAMIVSGSIQNTTTKLLE